MDQRERTHAIIPMIFGSFVLWSFAVLIFS